MNIELRNLTIITGDNFSDKSQILRNQIKNNNSFRYINQVNVNRNGKFVNNKQQLVRYPSGFFDANTDEVWALL